MDFEINIYDYLTGLFGESRNACNITVSHFEGNVYRISGNSYIFRLVRDWKELDAYLDAAAKNQYHSKLFNAAMGGELIEHQSAAV